jgi:hypothetical protein
MISAKACRGWYLSDSAFITALIKHAQSRRIKGMNVCTYVYICLSYRLPGTVEKAASSCTSLCANTRARIMSLNRLRTKATTGKHKQHYLFIYTRCCIHTVHTFNITLPVSFIDSLTPSWISWGPSINPWPPSRNMPVSVDTLVRVDLFWKIMLMVCPRSGLCPRAETIFHSIDAI